MSDLITATIEAPGYRSSVEIPVDHPDKAEAFVGWFQMQMEHLARWKPGASMSVSEKIPVASP